ncbi:mannitol-1-phosphate 5-dehydrogenase [Erysipelotrichaceae bacterium]|nr:mannitol-1-phosphate 5-dehydrogenase [Erysipelotrichaceae bacterium]
MAKLLQIGAGNIGRGFIARLFYNNGYDIMFADVDLEMVSLLNARKQYLVEVSMQEIQQEYIVLESACDSNDSTAFQTCFRNASIITTAVGASILKYVAENIATAIKVKMQQEDWRKQTIIACENYIRASSYLKELVFKKLTSDEQAFCKKTITFADCAVDCIVPPSHTENRTTVRVEQFYELVIEQTGIVDLELLAIPDIIFTEDVIPFIERKLFTLNAAHATTAYLGHYLDYHLIDEAIADPRIRLFITKMMEKNGEILCQKHGFDPQAHAIYIDKIITRFDNRFLADDVARVGRDLLRKIRNNERLIAPINEGLKLGINCEILYQVVAIALHYINNQELDTLIVQRLFDTRDIEPTLRYLTGLEDTVAIEAIASAYMRIEKEGITWIFQYS